MKKYTWLIIGVVALVLVAGVVLNIPAKQTNPMGSECVEDGSCCEDDTACTCG